MGKLQNTENIVLLGAVLGVVGVIAALALVWAANLTKKPIADALAARQNESLALVLPAFDNRPMAEMRTLAGPAGRVYKLYPATQQGRPVGWAVEGAAKGYGGDVTVLVGFNPDVTVRTVLVLSHTETPGLGSNVCERKEKKTIFTLGKPPLQALPKNRILDQFAGKKSDGSGWKLKKDGGEFDSVTGATVTSRAVTKLVGDIAGAVREHAKGGVQ